jgi:hypothetical protein
MGAFSQPIDLGLKKEGGLKIVLSPAPKLDLTGVRACSEQRFYGAGVQAGAQLRRGSDAHRAVGVRTGGFIACRISKAD